MKKSAIVMTVLTVLLLVAGTGLIIFGLIEQPRVMTYQDDWSFFSWSYTYYSTENAFMTDRLFDLGRTFMTCGIVCLGFTFLLTDTKKCGKKDPRKKAYTEGSYENASDARYESVKTEGKPAENAEGKTCSSCQGGEKSDGKNDVIQL